MQTKLGIWKNQAWFFIEKPVYLMNLPMCRCLLKLLVCKRLQRSIKKRLFSEVQKPVVFPNLGEKVALKMPKLADVMCRRKVPKTTLLYMVG